MPILLDTLLAMTTTHEGRALKKLLEDNRKTIQDFGNNVRATRGAKKGKIGITWPSASKYIETETMTPAQWNNCKAALERMKLDPNKVRPEGGNARDAEIIAILNQYTTAQLNEILLLLRSDRASQNVEGMLVALLTGREQKQQ